MKVKVDKSDLDSMLFMAFRYALPRHTYVTSEVRLLIQEYVSSLTTMTLRMIKKEIEVALQPPSSIWDMDKEEWSQAVNTINQELETRGIVNE